MKCDELDIYEVTQLAGYSQPAIERMIRLGKFPQPRRIVPNKRQRFWTKQQVFDWLVENEPRISARYRHIRRSMALLEAELG